MGTTALNRWITTMGIVTLAVSLVMFSRGSAFAQSDCDPLDNQLSQICERYCEKEQCDESDPERFECQRLRLTFEKKGGGSTFPCDPAVPLPTSGCEQLTGQPRRLCERYCIKRNCDEVESRHCRRLRITFERKTGSEIFPCDLIPVPTATETPPVVTTATATPTPIATGPTPESTITAAPTAEPTAEPTVEPTVGPTGEPTVTVEPTAGPTGEPTSTVEPTVAPTGEPTVTVEPTAEPTAEPTPQPTVEPTTTVEPTVEPSPGLACPELIDVEGTAGSLGVLDSGWTGQAHDLTVVDEGKITVMVTGCANATEPCGVCTFTGPVPNMGAGAGDIDNQRCTGNTNTLCSTNADCSGAGGTCEFFFGTVLPISAGGVSTCVINRVVGDITGTANTDTGDAASTVQLLSTVFSGPTADNPCPKCVGDATPNDGVQGGTCNSGQNANAMCDINGSSPIATFGSTSLDCPPLVGGKIADLVIDLSNTTGTVTRTLSAESPNCTAAGFSALECFCNTCNTAAAESCDDNGDCPDGPDAPGAPAIGAICGGTRCIGGTSAGAACTMTTQCGAGSSCGRPGAGTAPNQCDDAACTPDTGNEGTCAAGPFETFCAPEETFRGCSTNADCPLAGDTCSLGKFRECFTDNGLVGASVSATGVADPPDANGESDPTIAALFCIGPTSASAVNSVAGLPGLGRIELPSHARELQLP